MASRQAWKDGTPNRWQMAAIPHCIWRGIRSSGTPITSSGRMSRTMRNTSLPTQASMYRPMSTTGGLATRAPTRAIGGRAAGGEVGAEALAGQGQPISVDVGSAFPTRRAPRPAEPRSRAGRSATGCRACSPAGRDRRRRRRSTPARPRVPRGGSRAPRRWSRTRPRRSGWDGGPTLPRGRPGPDQVPGKGSPLEGDLDRLHRRVQQVRRPRAKQAWLCSPVRCDRSATPSA